MSMAIPVHFCFLQPCTFLSSFNGTACIGCFLHIKTCCRRGVYPLPRFVRKLLPLYNLLAMLCVLTFIYAPDLCHSEKCQNSHEGIYISWHFAPFHCCQKFASWLSNLDLGIGTCLSPCCLCVLIIFPD